MLHIFDLTLVCVLPQLADRRTSLANDELRNAKVSALHLKTKSMGNPSKCSDLPIASLGEKTDISEISFPGRLPPPSKSRHLQPMPLPPSPQSGCKTPGKRPGVGGDNFIPPNLLSELNSVLSKTGRKADDWPQEKRRWGTGSNVSMRRRRKDPTVLQGALGN